MPAPAASIVLGLGNTLHSDDGIGPQAIERLRRDPRVPAEVSLIEGGTLGLELLTYIWDCSYLLVLDAVDVGQPPGTLVRMSGQELQTLPGKGSAHQLGVADLLVALRILAKQTPEVVLLGVQPASTEWGTELSPAVAAVLPALADAAVAEVCRRPHTQASSDRSAEARTRPVLDHFEVCRSSQTPVTMQESTAAEESRRVPRDTGKNP